MGDFPLRADFRFTIAAGKEAGMDGDPLSVDFRTVPLATIDAGLRCRAAVALFGVSPSTAIGS